MQLPTLAADGQKLLTSFAEKLDGLGVDVPDVKYVGSGMIAWDGESLTVVLGGISQGQPGIPFDGTFIPPEATVTWATWYVQLLRPVAALYGNAGVGVMTPSPDILSDEGSMAVDDARGLVMAAIQIHQDYSSTGPGEGFSIGGVAPLGPEGGMAAQRLTIHASLA